MTNVETNVRKSLPLSDLSLNSETITATNDTCSTCSSSIATIPSSLTTTDVGRELRTHVNRKMKRPMKTSESYVIIVQQQQRQLRRNDSARNSSRNKTACCFRLFIVIYYFKYLLSKLKNTLIAFLVIGIVALAVYLLVIGVLNLHNCPVDYRIPLYLLVLAIAVVFRILLHIACPFHYSSYRKLAAILMGRHRKRRRPSSKDKRNGCYDKLRSTFKSLSSQLEYQKKHDNEPRMGSKSSMPKSKNKRFYRQQQQQQSSTSVFSFISHKFSETSEVRTKPAKRLNNNYHSKYKKNPNKLTVMRNHHHRHHHVHHKRRVQQKYKFVDLNTVRYAIAKCIQRSIDVFLLCWFVYGNYVVFSVPRSDLLLFNTNVIASTSANGTHTHYNETFIESSICNLICYRTAFLQILLTYVSFAVLLVTFFFYSAIKLVYKLLKLKFQKSNVSRSSSYV